MRQVRAITASGLQRMPDLLAMYKMLCLGQVDGFLILLFGLISINTLTAISVIRYIKGCQPQHGMLCLGQTYWVIIPLYSWYPYLVQVLMH